MSQKLTRTLTRRYKNRKLKPKKPTPHRYALYEEAVQCPEWHVHHFPKIVKEETGKEPKSLREDFCGTGRISIEWVRYGKGRTATGLDLDGEPLEYGKEHHLRPLPEEFKKRVNFIQQDVLKGTKEKFDLICACNFSFFTFRDRKIMRWYFESVLKSLKSKGALILEVAGGEGMIEELEESRHVTIPDYGKVKYTWDQKGYDPISSIADYAIHFDLPDGKKLKNAFTYHWRIWGIRELRDLLADAGFSRSAVYWETTNRQGDGSGVFVKAERGDHAHAWIAYIVGIKD